MKAMPHGGPLDGIRVIDLTQMLAGPYCTMLLADLGADVVKVEPLSGDPTRGQGPFLADDDLQAYGGYFQSVNRNKRSIAINVKSEAGRLVMLDLLRDADVVVENFRSGVMERLGLSYETIQEHNAKIVYAAIRGFGDPRTGQSPYCDWPAFDVVAQAMGGIMGITGNDAAHPLKVGPGVGDLFPATLAAVGLLAAVVKARETGLGQFVDVAMYDAVLSLCERIVFQYAYTGSAPTPGGNGHPLFCPFGVFPAKDGWVTIAAPWDHQWQEFCNLMGRAELARDERFNSNTKRVQHDALVRKIVGEWSQQRTLQEIANTLGGRVPYGPVNTAAEIFADPHVKAREMLLQLQQPGSDTPVQVAGTPIKFSGTPRVAAVRAPLTGEHTEAVLAEVGVTTARIAELRSAGAIG